MNTICFTGWQQPADALARIAPPDALHVSYADYTNVPECFANLPKKAELAIGWSLGGQLLVRAVAGKHMSVKRVILLGAPFQFLASDDYPQGMPPAMWGDVVEGYQKDPSAMLRQFAGLISAGDVHAARIARTLSASVSVWSNGMFWLEELGRFSCDTLDFTDFPSTLIIHGDSDKIIFPAQAALFANALPLARLHMLEHCAHAPHLHDTLALKALVDSYV